MKIKPFEISSSNDSSLYKYEFSFITLVNDKLQYEQLIKSCEIASFNKINSEFYYLDNINHNAYL